MTGKLALSETEFLELEKETEEFCDKLKRKIKEKKIKADVFIGGSLAKGTILKREEYDIDIFVRFSQEYKDEEISKLLEKVLDKRKIKIHGSRDYFQIKSGNKIFEIIPITKISNPKAMRNVTDLSYFHVSYVKNKTKKNKKLAGEIILAKAFCRAGNCYGAESYIKGFSGYGLELLISYYGSFLKFIEAMVKQEGQIVIDPEKHFKNKQEVLVNLNEAKLSSPIVFVDPTYKERNALAALSNETFLKFQEICKKFLRNPSEKFFKKKEIDAGKFNLILEAETDRQEGDIAGSKLLKFFRILRSSLAKYFDILKEDFEYGERQKAAYYFNIKKKKELILNGPPITAIENLAAFRKKHKHVFVKKGKLYAREKISFNEKEFVSEFKKNNKNMMKSMGIIGLKII